MNKLVVNIQNYNNVNVVSSRIVAEQLKKEHKHVLEKLKEIGQDFDPSWILESEYKDSMNRTKKEYLLTKDGFIMLCMNYTGYNEFKRAYIAEFNRMEQALIQNQFKLPKTYKEALIELVNKEEQIELITEERDHAIKTKGQISNSREASVMSKYGHALRELEELKQKVSDFGVYPTHQIYLRNQQWFSENMMYHYSDEAGKIITTQRYKAWKKAFKRDSFNAQLAGWKQPKGTIRYKLGGRIRKAFDITNVIKSLNDIMAPILGMEDDYNLVFDGWLQEDTTRCDKYQQEDVLILIETVE